MTVGSRNLKYTAILSILGKMVAATEFYSVKSP